MAGQIGDLIFQMMGQKDPRDELIAAMAGGGTPGMPQAAGSTPSAGGMAPGTAGPGAPVPPPDQTPEAYKSPPQLIQLYSDLLKRQDLNAGINRGIGLIGASLAHDENKNSILATMSDADYNGSNNPTGLVNNLLALRANQTTAATKAAQRASLPSIAEKYGLDLPTAQYLFDTGKLDEVIANAAKPDNQIVTDPNTGQSHIVNKTTGEIGPALGPAKERELEIVKDENTGKQIVVDKVTKEPIAGRAPISEGVRKTEYIKDPVSGAETLVYSDDKTPVPDRDRIQGSGNTTDQQNYNAAMRGLPAEKQIPFNDWLSQQNVQKNKNVGADGVDYGDPPKDMAWKRDSANKIMTNEQNAPIAIPVEGGPMDVKNKADAETKKVVEAKKQVANSIVVNKIDSVLGNLKENKDSWNSGTGWSSLLSGVPGKAHDLQEDINTIKANVGFDKLSEMRASNPNGSALGPVSDFENKLLQGVAGSLDLMQGPEKISDNLRVIRALYDAVVTTGIKDQAQADSIAAAARGGGSEPPIEDLVKKWNK